MDKYNSVHGAHGAPRAPCALVIKSDVFAHFNPKTTTTATTTTMSQYAQNVYTCDDWVSRNTPEACKDPITHWPQWFGDTPAYAPWAALVDEKLCQLMAKARSAPICAVGDFKDQRDVKLFIESDEFAKLVKAYLDKHWHLKPYVVPDQPTRCAFYLNTDRMASMCPLLKAKK